VESTTKYPARNSEFAMTLFCARHSRGADPKNASSAVHEITNRYACPFDVKAHGEMRTAGIPIHDAIFRNTSQVSERQAIHSN
jgi:hypothetical protein